MSVIREEEALMNKRTSHAMILALFLLIAASVGCKMLGGGSSQKNGGSDTKNAKGLPAAQICQMLAHPSFEKRFPYDGNGCSGSTTFGARDTRTASYETDTRPSFSYAAIGEQNVITKVRLNMTNRADGAEFFAAEGDAVAKLINGQPLPNEIKNAITSPLFTTGGDFTTTSKVGNAKVELVRSATDSRFSLSFDF
jgi:hypothetical protein